MQYEIDERLKDEFESLKASAELIQKVLMNTMIILKPIAFHMTLIH